MSDALNLRAFAYVLAVPDLDASTAYFRDVLGFRVDWADATDWRLLIRGGVRIMVGHCPGMMTPAEIADHSYFAYLEVDDVDALHAEFVARGALIRAAPADKPWGMREMHVATPDGHRMMFAHQLKPAP